MIPRVAHPVAWGSPLCAWHLWLLLVSIVAADNAMAQSPAEGTAAQSPVEGVRHRGQYLRTEVLRTDAQATYSCTLAPTSGSYPVLLVRRQERIKHQEVRIYGVVVEEKTTDAETGREGVTYRVSAGDEMRGETSTRETSRDLGAFANESFTLNGFSFRTDAAGLYVDTGQMLLKPFDDMSANSVDIGVQHKEMGSLSLHLSRYLTLRWEGKRPEERLQLVQTDVLVSLGADFEPVNPVGRDGLTLEVVVPETVEPGKETVIQVKAANAGKRAVSCLVGRLFSRHPWLTGANFYLGNIPPAGTREFERTVRVPAGTSTGPVFAVIGFWDILGPLKESAMPVATRVVKPSGSAATP